LQYASAVFGPVAGFDPREGISNPGLESRTHQLTGEDQSSFAFPREEDSTDSLARRDQIDVGISGRLQTGLGFFDPLIAASPGLALRLACLGTAKAGMTGGFSTFHDNHRTG
jgi:hypothetical protein